MIHVYALIGIYIYLVIAAITSKVLYDEFVKIGIDSDNHAAIAITCGFLWFISIPWFVYDLYFKDHTK